jgi:flagellar protein FliO/FliZ
MACATTLLLALFASPALAAGGTTSTSTTGTGTTTTGGDGFSTAFENKPIHLTSSNSATHVSSGSFSGSIVRTIVGLLIVIAVIYGLTWVIRQGKASKNAGSGDGLERVASLPLGTNKSVALVRVGDELHLLGVAEHGVTGIRVFSEDEAYELGLPFHSDDDDHVGGGPAPIQRIVDSFRRFTVR